MSEAEQPVTGNSVPIVAENGEHHVKIENDETSHSDAHPHRVTRRRSSSGGSAHEAKYGVEPEHKPTVEFVRPIEGTPAAEALAANKLIKVSKVTKGLHKIRGMKRPKMKNFNFVKKLNKTTKTKRKKKHFSKNFKGKVIDGVHELYTLTAGIMLGIRYTVGNAAFTATTVSVPDFTSVGNLAFPPNGSTDSAIPTPPHDLAHTFKFKSYAPKIFHRLREFYDISAAAYMDSVCGDYNFIEFISNSKSGQFFFYSHDGQYMLKTQTKEENKFMIRILPHYYQYLTENPNSLLVRILGMHRIKMYHLRRKVHFVVMTSVFDTPAQINTIYDLKGSLIGRSATQRERESGGVLKDNDLIADNCKLHLGAKKAAFMAQLEKDAMFLAKLNIMDYSLLVGIHKRSLRLPALPVTRESASSVTGGSAAMVAAAAAAGAVANSALSTFSTDTAAVPSNVSNHHALVASHSNTPFRRASLNATEGGEHGGLLHSAAGTPSTAVHRKRRSSTLDSTDLQRKEHAHIHAHGHAHGHGHGHGHRAELNGVVDHEGINVSMSRSRSRSHSVSGDEGDDHQHNHKHTNRTLFPSIILSSSASSHAGPSEVTDTGDQGTETEDEEEEDYIEEGENEEGEDDDSESEYEDVDAGDSDDERTCLDAAHAGQPAHQPTHAGNPAAAEGELVVEDGEGALGMEGFKLSELLREDAVRSSKSTHQGNVTNGTSSDATASSPVYAYGPGLARRHPWTSRRDEGINARMPDGTRGDEIYFLGVIDILQQYNANKRMETIFKGVTNDRTQISSVSPLKYAKRFVSFMDSNID